MNTLKLIAAWTLAGSALFGLGYSIGGSNFDIFGYPSFASKPAKPIKPYSKDPLLRDQYQMQVEEYVNSAKSYVKACNNDQQTIEEERGKAIRLANEVINEYNDYVRYGF